MEFLSGVDVNTVDDAQAIRQAAAAGGGLMTHHVMTHTEAPEGTVH